tara:strand:+ start:165 stop:734 length:570 start_codon:yes stop_codon:yes gene_type:complete
MIKLALFASGSGSNVEKIFKYFNNHSHILVDSIFCNNPNAYVIDRAKNLGLDSIIFDQSKTSDEDLLKMLQSRKISSIILAGYIRLIPEAIINKFEDKIVNIHPSLLPKFGGKGFYGSKVHDSVIESKEEYSGITIHLVNNEYDKGKILFQKKIKIQEHETASTLSKRIHELEHFYFPQIIEKFLLDKL